MKIGIAGPAGTGKSIFAERLAKEFNIPFLSSKSITGEILRRDGYDYASGEQVEKFLSTPSRQLEILTNTKQHHSEKAFVTDRTGVDLAAYAILELVGAFSIKVYLNECESLCKVYDYVFFCPWQDREIMDNHRRTLDPWYQFSVCAVERDVAKLFGVKLHEVRDDLDGRIEDVRGILA